MVIGIDFDNTIVCYDRTFLEIAESLSIAIESGGLSIKQQLARTIRSEPSGEYRWSCLQGEAYGPRVQNAQPYPGFIDFASKALREGHRVVIISHKTTFPSVGPQYPLRKHANQWIEQNLAPLILLGFKLDTDVFYEETQWSKAARIKTEACNFFVDDLEEILTHPEFPSSCRGIHFHPQSEHPSSFADWTTAELPPGRTAAISQVEPQKTEGLLESAEILLDDKLVDSTVASGGANSESKVATFQKHGRIFLKRYPSDKRGRREKEVQFLRYAANSIPDSIPKIIATSEPDNLIALSVLEGEEIATCPDSTDSTWKQSLQFLAQLQTNRDSAKLPRAAESAISLQEHLGFLTQRRNKWLSHVSEGDNLSVLGEWIQSELEETYQKLAKLLINNPLFKTRLNPQELIISPSDFGLHNAIRNNNGQLSFFDFEYAGMDDPAKTLSDFFNQPRHPAPAKLFDVWKRAIVEFLPQESQAAFERRVPLVHACCSLKWIYIILPHRFSENDLFASSANALNESSFLYLQNRLESLNASISER